MIFFVIKRLLRVLKTEVNDMVYKPRMFYVGGFVQIF